MARASWVDYFLGIADAVATRATCDRRHVGAVVVLNNMILSTGYNGAAAGLDHCDDVGHDMQDSHCVAAVHAEINAICQAARHGVALEGATLYCTDLPCWSCFKALVNAGIYRVFYREHYRADPRVLDAADKTKMFLAHIPRDTPDAQTDALLASRERAKHLTEILAQRKPRPPEELVGALQDTVHHEPGTVHQGVKVAPRASKVEITPDDVAKMAQESDDLNDSMRDVVQSMWKIDPADAAKPCCAVSSTPGPGTCPGPTWRQVELARAFYRGLHRLDFTAPEVRGEIQAELDLDEKNYRGLRPCQLCRGDGWMPYIRAIDQMADTTECRVCHGTGVDPESRHHEENLGGTVVNNREDTTKVWKVLWYNVGWAEILESTMIAMAVATTPEQAAARALRGWLDMDDVELDPVEDEVSLLFKVLDSAGHETKVEIVASRDWRFETKRI